MDENIKINILVTGSSGLVGHAICNWFLKRDHQVTGIVHSSGKIIDHENYKQIKVDLVSEEINIATNFNVVIHCAAIIPNKHNCENELLDLNQKIDANVFKFCNYHKIKIIYFSTAYMYENESGLLDEKSALRENLNGYYLSKQKSEELLINSKFESIIFRISSPYGAIDKQTNIMKIFAEKIKNNLPVVLIGSGERMQNFIHLNDLAEACYRVVCKNIKGVYNLTYKHNYSMLDLASAIKEIYKTSSEFVFDHLKKDIQQNVNFDNTKLRSALMWEPYIDLKTGLVQTLMS